MLLGSCIKPSLWAGYVGMEKASLKIIPNSEVETANPRSSARIEEEVHGQRGEALRHLHGGWLLLYQRSLARISGSRSVLEFNHHPLERGAGDCEVVLTVVKLGGKGKTYLLNRFAPVDRA